MADGVGAEGPDGGASGGGRIRGLGGIGREGRIRGALLLLLLYLPALLSCMSLACLLALNLGFP